MGFNRKMGKELEEALRAQREGQSEDQDDVDEDAEGNEAEEVNELMEGTTKEDKEETLESKTLADVKEKEGASEATKDNESNQQALTAEALSSLAELSLTTSTVKPKDSGQRCNARTNLKKAAGWAI